MAITTTSSYYINTNTNTATNVWWSTLEPPDWGEPWPEQKIKSKENKCSVQEPPRKKNLRYLNRPA